MKKHTFAICAYKESKYLEACIQSLKKQTVKTNIILVTSTPNQYIEDLCKKYEIFLCFVRIPIIFRNIFRLRPSKKPSGMLYCLIESANRGRQKR